jgi:hypothetical protein
VEQLIGDCSGRSKVIRGGATSASYFRLPAGKHIVPDLLVQMDQQTVVIDVARCNPAAQFYVGAVSDRGAGKAAAMMERIKLYKYRMVRGLVDSGNFVPIVVESTSYFDN